MIGLLLRFAPWILVLTVGRRDFRSAALLGLGCACCLNAPRLVSKRMRTTDWVGLIVLSLLTAISFSRWRAVAQLWALPAVNALLAAVALHSILAGRPFVGEIAREREPERLWTHPLFVRLTAQLSWFWTAILAAMAALQTIGVLSPGSVLARWFWPYVLFFAALAASLVYIRHARRRNLERERAEALQMSVSSAGPGGPQ